MTQSTDTRETKHFRTNKYREKLSWFVIVEDIMAQESLRMTKTLLV